MIGRNYKYWQGVAIHVALGGDLMAARTNRLTERKRIDELTCNGKLVRLVTLNGEKTGIYASKPIARKLQDEGICKTEPHLNGKVVSSVEVKSVKVAKKNVSLSPEEHLMGYHWPG